MPGNQDPNGRSAALAGLPSVDRALGTPPFSDLLERFGRRLVLGLVREDLERLRSRVLEGKVLPEAVPAEAAPEAIARRVAARAEEALTPRPRPVINATGVVVHTNLGRAVLSGPAAARVSEALTGYLDLEYDVARGHRGKRGDHLKALMAVLFPGTDFVVVNNNAAAILLALRALARGKEVAISRGELVEIGGSFRVPDIMKVSGAKLREVGTTNRTRVSDYVEAVGPKTGAFLKVHASNFEIVGFTEATPIAELAEAARAAGVPLIVDQGSGGLVDLAPHGITDEIPVHRVLEDGADVVTFSGDKLLGGPQAGFAVGKPEVVAKLKRDPLARVCRLDRILTAALHETLSAYVRDRAEREVPVLRMLALDRRAIAARAADVVARVKAALDEGAGTTASAAVLEIVDGVSRTGGGSSPGGERETALIAISGVKAARLERRLREARPAIVARVQDDRVLLDLRTVIPERDEDAARGLVEALRGAAR